jgi:hypothetical protein
MSTNPSTRWRLALGLAGAAMALGGPLHPESDGADPLREELATMTAGDTWVLSHSLLAVGAALLAVGLWVAHRGGTWPASTHRALRVAAVALTAYVVETVFHLAAVIDSDALAAGDPAPVAFSHIGLALVLYPVSGIALAWLGAVLFRAVALPEKVFGVVAVVGGLLHAASVPLTIVFPDVELTPVFAASGMLFAAWSLGVGVSGLRTARAAADRAAAAISPALLAASPPAQPSA